MPSNSQTSPSPYGESLTLLTDLYELTMAYGYWKTGMQNHDAVFDLIFRSHPFHGGFTVACGLAPAIDLLRAFHFDDSDCSYLTSLRGNDQEPLFEDKFIGFLAGMKLSCDIDVIPEGTVVFPQEPLVRVQGPLIQCQIVETLLLNVINFQTLIATKAARVALAAQGAPVLEFGLRRAQGVDGGLSASRAAYVGGCAGTSNVLAGKIYGIPVKGTHAHSWVMSFPDEASSFEAYAEAMPNNCIFLVDTYDTIEGVREAIRVGGQLRGRGHQMVGIRLDSGNLASLSQQARRMLDDAGFPDAVIVGSGDLDETKIAELNKHGAKIGVWGVGTRIATGYEDPALTGVYKISAVKEPGGDWEFKLKLSEEPGKMSNPGVLQVRRFRRDDMFVGDIIYDEAHPPQQGWTLVGTQDESYRRTIPTGLSGEDLLVPAFRQGRCVYRNPSLPEIRERVQDQLRAFPPGVKHLRDHEAYPVGLEQSLHDLKSKMIAEARAKTGQSV